MVNLHDQSGDNMRYPHLFLFASSTAILAACGGTAVVAPKQMACNEITTATLGIPNLSITASNSVAASATTGTAVSYPSHCQVLGTINQRTGVDGNSYAIKIDIRLPTSGWNGKFFYSGDAGLAGEFNDVYGKNALGGSDNALTRGYAVASTNGGHQIGGLDGSFGLDPQARIDYGYNALGTATPIAKNIVKTFYGTSPSRSYYSGCSKGGQSGLMAASRFSNHFDGIIAGNPGMDLPKASIGQIWDVQKLAAINSNISQAFSQADLNLVASSVLNKCDALDGALDGMVTNISACKTAFNPARDIAQCATSVKPDGTCLSETQKTSLIAIFEGAKSSTGAALYSDWPWDPGMAGSNWTFWKTFLNPALGVVAMSNIWATPPTTTATAAFTPAATSYLQNYNFDLAYTQIYSTNLVFGESSMSFMGMPDPYLTSAKSKSKVIVYHGTADPVFSSNYTQSWYDKLSSRDSTAANFARLYLIPGMTHCSGGRATDSFDAFSPLVAWVENGTAPDSIPAKVTSSNKDLPTDWSSTRSRPLCSYPKQAILKNGATDIESATSFVCQ